MKGVCVPGSLDDNNWGNNQPNKNPTDSQTDKQADRQKKRMIERPTMISLNVSVLTEQVQQARTGVTTIWPGPDVSLATAHAPWPAHALMTSSCLPVWSSPRSGPTGAGISGYSGSRPGKTDSPPNVCARWWATSAGLTSWLSTDAPWWRTLVTTSAWCPHGARFEADEEEACGAVVAADADLDRDSPWLLVRIFCLS